MSSKMLFESLRAELTDANGKIYNVQLDLKVKEIYVDESPRPVSRAIAETALSPASGQGIPDGRYTLTFTFIGKPEKHNVRVESGMLLAG